MKVTLFVDVLSHWCLAAVPAARALAGLGIGLEVVYAPLKDGAPLGFTHEMESWFYERGARAYGMTLSAAWCEGPATSSWAANAGAFVAGEIIGNQLDAAYGMMAAAMERGALVGRPQEAYAQAALVAGVSPDEIERLATQARVRATLLEGNERLAALGADERPTWHVQNDNGDFAILKGIWQQEPLLAVAQALHDDEKAYAAAGDPPVFRSS